MKTKEYLKWLGIAFSLFLFLPALSQGQTMKIPSGDYEVGRLIRPLGVPFAERLDLPFHHDVLVRKTGEKGIHRGFFADSFKEAYQALQKERDGEGDGYVSGHIADEGKWGREDLFPVTYTVYGRLIVNMVSSTSNRYHIIRYNCQTWAAEQITEALKL